MLRGSTKFFQVPVYGFHDAGFEVLIGLPAEFGNNLGGVDGVASVVSGAVGNEGHEFFILGAVFARTAFIQNGADLVQDLEIVALIVAADIVGFAAPALVEDKVDGLAVVEHVEPVADVGTVAVYGNGLFSKAFADDDGNELFVFEQLEVVTFMP